MRWVAVSMLLLLGCGSRTGLGQDEADASRPPPPRRDAGPDAPPPPPPMGCTLGPLRGPYVEGSPAFLFSLTRYEDPFADSEGEYLVGYSQGWPPDERAAVALLDFRLEAFHMVTPVPGEQVAASQRDFWVMQQREDDNVLDVAWLELTAGAWEERTLTNVCRDCFASWSAMAPVLDGERGAFAYETPGGVVVWSVAAGGGEPPLTAAFMGEEGPRLAAHPSGYVLVTNPPDRGTSTLRFLGRDLSERARHDVPVISTGEAPGLLVRDDDVLVIGRASPEGAMHLVSVDEELGVVDRRPLPVDMGLYLGVGVARDHGLLAITLEGINDVKLLVLEEASFDVALEPTLITERGSYRRSPHVATHPDGFAVVYGGWEPGGTYGIFGRLVSCADAG